MFRRKLCCAVSAPVALCVMALAVQPAQADPIADAHAAVDAISANIAGIDTAPAAQLAHSTIDQAAAAFNQALGAAGFDPAATGYGSLTGGIPKTDTQNAQAAAPQQQGPRGPVESAGEILDTPIRPRLDGPNHHWKTDPLSMLMAAHPGPVLHRAPGSWFNAPDVPREAYVAEAQNQALVGPSTPLYMGEEALCTLAVAGYDKEGNKIGITAGHCGNPGDPVLSADSWPIGPIGYVVRHDARRDYALIRFEDNAKLSRSYNGVRVDELGWNDGQGHTVCKTGVATGTSCGIQFMADKRVSLSQVCAMPGDSGAPVRIGNKLVGLIGGGLVPGGKFSCTTPLQGPLHAPTVTHSIDEITADLNARDGYGAGFMLPDEAGNNPAAATK